MKKYCNPLNLNYRFQHKLSFNAFREAADPTLVLFKDRYYIFASMGGGFWYSDDLFDWKFKEMTTEMYSYAPDVRQIGDYLYFSASKHKKNWIYRTKDPMSGEFEKVSKIFPFWDPDIFEDDDKRVYFYWGCNNKTPIYGVELDNKTFKPITEKKGLIGNRYEKCGWEKTELYREPPRTKFDERKLAFVGNLPYIEGAYMTKHDGKYYLQYAAPATEVNAYGNGVYVSDSPLGDFKVQKHNPFSSKPAGFIRAAGHGSTIEDKYGNFWHIASMSISVNEAFERRLGLFPVGFDKDGTMFANQFLCDFPIEIPDGKFDPLSVKPRQMLLSYKAKATASSVYGDNTPDKGVNEDIKTWWCANSSNAGEWYQIDLGKEREIESVQVNFADCEVPQLKKVKKSGSFYDKRYIDINSDLKTRWQLLASLDGENWTVVIDKKNAETNFCNDFITLEEKVNARYLKVVGYEFPYNSRMAISGLRVFGVGDEELCAKTSNVVAKRVSGYEAKITWDKVDGKVGYVVSYGVKPDALYSTWEVFEGESVNITFLDEDNKNYYCRVDVFNEKGITQGDVVEIK